MPCFHLCNFLESSNGFRAEAHVSLPAGISVTCLPHLARMQSLPSDWFVGPFLIIFSRWSVCRSSVLLLVIYDQIFKITPFASFLHNNMKQKGCLCLCEGVQGSANSEFNHGHTELMSVLFPSCCSAKLCITYPRTGLCLNITEEETDKEDATFFYL